MSVDVLPLPPPAMFSSSSSSSEHPAANKFVNFGCAECEGQAEHERIKSLLKQKKGKGGKSGKLTENPESESQVWTKSSYSTLPNPRSRGYSQGGGREKHQGHHQHQDQPGSQVWAALSREWCPQIVGWQILSSKNRTQVKAPEVYFKAIPKTVGANKEHAGRSVGDVGDSFLYFSAKITLSELWSMSLLSIKHIFHTTTRLIFIEHKMCKWFHL